MTKDHENVVEYNSIHYFTRICLALHQYQRRQLQNPIEDQRVKDLIKNSLNVLDLSVTKSFGTKTQKENYRSLIHFLTITLTPKWEHIFQMSLTEVVDEIQSLDRYMAEKMQK